MGQVGEVAGGAMMTTTPTTPTTLNAPNTPSTANTPNGPSSPKSRCIVPDDFYIRIVKFSPDMPIG